MTIGTKIIESALEEIGAHSVVSPANPESIQTAKNVLNGMIAAWEDDGIVMGCSPLKEPGSELSEPLGASNGIVYNLAILLAPKFPGAVVTPLLLRNAQKTLNKIENHWRTLTIPNMSVRGTLPKGQGNFIYEKTFFDEGDELG